ncbi:TIR domain-containing protein [Geodermatophilus telluris]|uniref:TIR domain-containing protein n=1 Tax=Geodermatophilus telluris TaxID=1190417 RepID=A0A1G6V2Z7_9ACTN|nr:toll/interleukin-1 receptor domain-containing protein [Geodermatophilus telluris]SDD47898.1 TIR domain-containing protein [Geodermatophilus telluris]
MRIVISYAREDRAVVEELVETLRLLGHDPWTDAGAHSGSRWWDEIVLRIQQCDLLLAVTSPASLVSRACTLERRYALELGRLLLPVQVAPVNMQGLPSEFAQIQFFDYRTRDSASTGRLYRALAQLPPPRPLPRPLPPPPPPPLSYLNQISDLVSALVPDAYLQDRIVTDLTTGLRSADPEERTTAADLLRRFAEHPQSLQGPAERARQALAGAPRDRPAWQGWQGGPPLPGPATRSRVTRVLAWIGGVTVVLVGLGIWGAVEMGGTSTLSGDVVAQRVYDELVAQGFVPTAVQCGSLSAEVGASTWCQTAGLTFPGVTVTVSAVRGSEVDLLLE